jgi:hypothetical protein
VPVVDQEIVTVKAPAGRSWRRTFAVVHLPALPAPTAPGFRALFAKKMAVCEELYAFVGDPREQPQIENKTKTLQEIRQSFGSHEPLQDRDCALLFHMIEVNILRPMPPVSPGVLSFRDLPPFAEPQWPHLSIVYSILSKLATLNPNLPQFSRPLWRKLLIPAGSPDPNERSAVVQFFTTLIKVRSGICPELIELFETVLIDYRHYTSSPFVPTTVLQVVYYIFNETVPLLPNAARVFVRAIVPLFGAQYLMLFNDSMDKLLQFFLEDNNALAVEVVRVLVNRFPVSLAGKMQAMLSHMQRVIQMIPLRGLQTWAVPIARALARAAQCGSEAVAQSAVGFWSKNEGNRLLTGQKKLVIPVIVPVICDIVLEHWSPAVRAAAQANFNVLNQHDSLAVKEAMRQRNHGGVREEIPQLRVWMAVLRAAQMNDGEILVGEKIQEINRAFRQAGVARIDSLPVSRPSCSRRLPLMNNTLAGRTHTLIIPRPNRP